MNVTRWQLLTMFKHATVYARNPNDSGEATYGRPHTYIYIIIIDYPGH